MDPYMKQLPAGTVRAAGPGSHPAPDTFLIEGWLEALNVLIYEIAPAGENGWIAIK